MVERSLCMRKVKGSMPFSSILKGRYRLMVRTLVFETSNPGSIPGNAKRQKKCFLHSKKNNFIVWSQKPILIEKKTV